MTITGRVTMTDAARPTATSTERRPAEPVLEALTAVEALARSYLRLFEATKEVGCSYVYGWMRRETVHVMLDLTLVYTVTTSCVIGSRVGGIRDSRILDCNFPPDFVSMRIRREGSRSSITNMCKSHSL